MALIKLGVAVAAISGSLAGTTFARNRGGAYMRNRTTPLNPNSPRQNFVRTTFAGLSNAWSTELSQVQRDEWNQYAAQVPVQNRLGEQIFLTGINMYVRANSLLLDTGGIRRDDGPLEFTQGPSIIPNLVVTAVTDIIDITDLGLFTPGSPDIGFLLSQGTTQQAGVSFFNGPFRKIDGITVTAALPVFPVLAIAAAFPFNVGQAVFLRTRAVSIDGRVGPDTVQRFLA